MTIAARRLFLMKVPFLGRSSLTGNALDRQAEEL
jgi:hypothetical protein